MGKTLDFLKSCGVFFVSTCDGAFPAARPFGAVMEYEGRLYLSTGRTKDVYRQMKANPHIQIAALKSGSREWLRLSGRAVEEPSPALKRRMLAECPALLKRFASEASPEFALFRVEDARAFLHTDAETIELAD